MDYATAVNRLQCQVVPGLIGGSQTPADRPRFLPRVPPCPANVG